MTTTGTTVGTGAYTFQYVKDWPKLPRGMTLGPVSAIATDSQDRVYIFHRKDPPVVVCDPDGNYLNGWGNGAFEYAHGFYIANDIVYLTDRNTSVCIMYTLDGKPIQMLGKHGVHSDTGAMKPMDPVLRPSGPFNYPSEMVPSPWGDLYVSDGYRNCRVHRFDSGGHLIQSWGTWGKTEPNQFHLPHSILVDETHMVYVCDRENHRVQVFSPGGEFKEMWTDLQQPMDIAEFPDGNFLISEGAAGGAGGKTPRCSVVDKHGKVLARWTSRSAHGCWVDSQANCYLALTGDKSVDKCVRR
jgi:DNA-binding beta-propeller fold protein YncE